MNKEIVTVEQIARRICYVRGEKVLLDVDLAALYGVATKVLNQAVRRNRGRFPDDFMFQLTPEEGLNLRSQIVTSSSQGAEDQAAGKNSSQIVTSSKRHGGRRYRPYVFTEQGVAMLSSVLNSGRAVRVNIAIMRAFVRLRQTLDANRELARKFEQLERRVGKHDDEIAAILEAIRQLMTPPEKPRREIGFHVRENAAHYRTRKKAGHV
jgi:ORF6N domain